MATDAETAFRDNLGWVRGRADARRAHYGNAMDKTDARDTAEQALADKAMTTKPAYAGLKQMVNNDVDARIGIPSRSKHGYNPRRDAFVSIDDPKQSVDAIDSAPDPAATAELQDMLARFKDAGLTDNERTVIDRLFLDGKTMRAVAQELGTSLNTVLYTTHKALAKMKKVWEHQSGFSHGLKLVEQQLVLARLHEAVATPQLPRVICNILLNAVD